MDSLIKGHELLASRGEVGINTGLCSMREMFDKDISCTVRQSSP